MNPDFIVILQKLISEQGKEALMHPAKCKALLADYTCGEYKNESRLVLQALEAGAAKAIDSADDLEICWKQQVRTLREDYFLAANAAADVAGTLILALRGYTVRSKITPELQEQNTASGDSEASFVHFKRGKTCMDQRQFEAAIEEFTEALRLDSNNAPAYKLRGSLHERQDLFNEAIRDFSEALRLEPHDSYTYAVRGAAYSMLGEYYKAMEDYNEAIGLDPDSSDTSLAYSGRGQVYDLWGKKEESKEDWAKALSLDPEAKWFGYIRLGGLAWRMKITQNVLFKLNKLKINK